MITIEHEAARQSLREALVTWQYDADRIAMLAEDVDERDALKSSIREMYDEDDGVRMALAIAEVSGLKPVDDQVDVLDVSRPIF